MTNADAVFAALERLGTGWHTSREVMDEVRRAGFQMTTARAREICKVLARQGSVEMYHDARYFFQAAR